MRYGQLCVAGSPYISEAVYRVPVVPEKALALLLYPSSPKPSGGGAGWRKYIAIVALWAESQPPSLPGNPYRLYRRTSRCIPQSKRCIGIGRNNISSCQEGPAWKAVMGIPSPTRHNNRIIGLACLQIEPPNTNTTTPSSPNHPPQRAPTTMAQDPRSLLSKVRSPSALALLTPPS